MAESGAAELKIPDFSFEAFYAVLKHMYGLPLCEEPDLHVEVMVIADYYGLGGLKAEVELQLID